MAIYGTPVKRCEWCVKWELPCGPRVHDNVLARYVPLIESTHLTADQFAARSEVNYVSGEPITLNVKPRQAVPLGRARRLANRLSLVAIIVTILAGLAIGLGAYAVVIGSPLPNGPGCGTMCVPSTYRPPADTGGPELLTTAPTAPPTLPPDPGR